MNLVLIETSANQRYIFATNKLRENVGASELTHRVGTQFVLEAIASLTGGSLHDEDSERMRDNIRNQQKLEVAPDRSVEVVTATSGKAVLLVRDEETGREIIRNVTSRALKEAPGLTMHGAISRSFDLSESTLNLDHVFKTLHARFERAASSLAPQQQRFLRLPFFADCSTSGFPAAIQVKSPGGGSLRSNVSFKKQTTEPKRLWDIVRRLDETLFLAKSYRKLEELLSSTDEVSTQDPDDISKRMDWLAVIHADGNGLGSLFLKFGEYAEVKNGREYLNAYRRFSLALEACTENAFLGALKLLSSHFQEWVVKSGKGFEFPPVIPLVLGGDDLTVLCHGRFALQFTKKFLLAFEDETQKKEHFNGIISKVAHQAFKVGRLSSCAGVAIVKPHFPFHAAYDLAESLLQSAKKVKTTVEGPCSAMDFHVLYDSSNADLGRIRNQLEIDEGNEGKTRLTVKPYVVSNTTNESDGPTWASRHGLIWLETAVAAINAKDDTDKSRRKLPNSQLHDIREGLFLGKREADSRMHLIRKRYDQSGFENLLACAEGDGSLFFNEAEKGLESNQENTVSVTGFLDALEASEFWK